MAKKKSSRKNAFKVLLDFITMALSGVVLGFLALPHLSFKKTILGQEIVDNISGYSLLDFEADTAVATVILLIVIFASILALFALLKLLVDSGIIKNKTFAKVVQFVFVLSALALLVLEIVNCILIPANYCSGDIVIYHAVWAMLIVNALISLGSFVTSIFSIKK